MTEHNAGRDQYYEALLQTSPAAIVTIDLNDVVTAWNPAAERLFGYTRDEAIGRNVESLIAYTDDLRQDGMELNARVRAGEDMQLVTRRLRKDGTLVDVHVVASVIRADGEPLAYYAIYSDVGELQRQRRYYESLLETSPSAVAIVDMEGIITSWNPAAERVFGYTRGEAIGRNLDSLLAGVEPNDSLTLVSVGLVLTVAGILGSATPALRAANVDPVIALRHE